jgi:hypothetical protein
MTAAFDYLNSRDTADRLVTKFGQSVALRRNAASGSDYDPVLTPTDYATKGARIEFSWSQRQSGNVLATDERWMIAAGPLALLGITTILPDDLIVVGGVTRKAGPLSKAVSPAGTVVVFDVQAQI